MKDKKLQVILIILIAVVLLSGCWDQRNIEDTHPAIALGIDQAGDKVLVSFVAPVVEPEIEQQNLRVATLGITVRDAQQNFIKMLPKSPGFEKIQVVVIGSSAAKEGIMRFAKEFDRYRTIPHGADLVVTSLKAQSLLNLEIKDKPRVGIYIEKLLSNAQRHTIVPRVAVVDFINTFFDGGQDPYLPLVSYGPAGATEISISSLALFSGDKQVGVITDDEVTFLMMIMGKGQVANFTVALDPGDKAQQGDFVTVTARRIKNKIVPEYRNGRFVLHVSVDVVAWLNEYMGDLKLEKERDKKKLEEKVSQYMRQRIKELLYKLQAINSDPIGFGQYVRAKLSGKWNRDRWREDYLKAEFTVKTRVNISQYGDVK